MRHCISAGLGHLYKNGEDVLVVLPTGYGLIMANIKIFQLLPDVYDMLLGVTNSIVMQDRVAKLNDQGISACMIQGHSVLHYTMMMAAISNYHWIDLRTLFVYDKKIQAFLNVYCKPLNITRVHLIPNISPPMDHLHYRLNFDLDKNSITA